MKRGAYAAVWGVVGAVCVWTAWADQITLRSGGTLAGEIHEFSGRGALLVDTNKVVRVMPAADMAEIVFAPRRNGKLSLQDGSIARTGTAVRVRDGALLFDSSLGSQFFDLARVRLLELGDRFVPVTTLQLGYLGPPLAELAVPGKITLIFFRVKGWSTDLMQQAEDIAKTDPAVVLRYIDIGEWDSSVARGYGVTSLPDVRVFDGRRNRVGLNASNRTRIERYVQEAKKKP
ncbi:MAG: hypothetical protein JXR37_15330 [Kiritimatiellae bacterium]|nr:hypothetical protein [Kiritimatiellia bacterium]